jgi:hypothetical protein
MPRNPLSDLEPALRILAENAHVIPATGQAMADLMLPDIDELYDRVDLGNDARHAISAVAEDHNREIHRPVAEIHRRDRHIYRFFLDGSANTHYLGNVLEHERQSPVHLAQIGAVAIRREDNGRVRIADRDRRLLLLLDRDSLSPDLYQAVTQALASTDGCELINSGSDDDPLSSGVQAAREPRSRAAHKANWQMRILEKTVAARMAEKVSLEADEHLILDGSLGSEYVEDWKLARAPHVGVVKSTWKGMRFEIGRERRRVNLFQLLAELPAGHRTIAFSLRGGRLATWFVRLRGPDYLQFPLMGTLRVEVPVTGDGQIATEVVDNLSGALLAERSVTPYGKDPRWHSHLYPIWLAERAITQNLFMPENVLKAALRWPLAPLNLGEAK